MILLGGKHTRTDHIHPILTLVKHAARIDISRRSMNSIASCDSQPSDFLRNWQASCLTAVLHFGSQKNRIHEFRVVFLILSNPSFPNTRPKLMSNTVGCYFFAGYFYLWHVVPTSAIPYKLSQLLLKFASYAIKSAKTFGQTLPLYKVNQFL